MSRLTFSLFRRLAALLLGVGLVATACGASESVDADSAASVESAQTDASQDEPEQSEPVVEDEDAADEPAEDETATVTAAVPDLTAGIVNEDTVTVDGVDIDYVAVIPPGFEIGDTAPVLLAMPPGSQDRSLTQRVTSGTYANEALARGWVVVSPAAPNGDLYFNGSEALIPGLLGWMQTWVTPEGGRPHLAGISNGGISSFRLAGNQPTAFASMIVFPGFPRSAEDKAALEQLAAIPVRMFVGETDTGWIPAMEEARDALSGFGADIELDIREGEGHVMQSLSDGVEVFDLLDSFREG